MTTGKFKWVGGDVHIYQNQLEGIKEQMERSPLNSTATVTISKAGKSLFDITYDDIEIHDYQSHPAIKFPAAAV